jgi:uncharacterized Zn finger protein
MSRRTEFAATWWAQRWIRLLERFGWSARLNRGRAYARHGNVLDIDVQSGLVRAKVQGSRKQPYRVEIGLKPIARADWDRVFQLLRRKAVYAAKLLSGEMPRDIEEIFKAAEVPLFPRSGEDLVMSCTCPDWASPCKHVAAVYYVLGSEFDRDPFLLFELRGKSKEQVMNALRGGGRRNERPQGSRAPRIASEPLEEHLNDFWQAGDELDDITIRVGPPPVPQAILKRLGPLPLRDLPEEWYGDLARMYETVSRDALAFVNVSGSARAPRIGDAVNGDAADSKHLPNVSIISENPDDPAAGDILTDGEVSEIAGQTLVEPTDDVPPYDGLNGYANGSNGSSGEPPLDPIGLIEGADVPLIDEMPPASGSNGSAGESRPRRYDSGRRNYRDRRRGRGRGDNRRPAPSQSSEGFGAPAGDGTPEAAPPSDLTPPASASTPPASPAGTEPTQEAQSTAEPAKTTPVKPIRRRTPRAVPPSAGETPSQPPSAEQPAQPERTAETNVAGTPAATPKPRTRRTRATAADIADTASQADASDQAASPPRKRTRTRKTDPEAE